MRIEEITVKAESESQARVKAAETLTDRGLVIREVILGLEENPVGTWTCKVRVERR
jgi:hypothetical protein